MTQHPRARATDPVTSKEAADRAEAFAESQSERVLRAVVEKPGLTACEIAERCGLDRHAVSRRLPELRRDGKIESGKERLCTVKHTRQMTWMPTLFWGAA